MPKVSDRIKFVLFRTIRVGELHLRHLGLNAMRHLRSRKHRVIQIIIHIVIALYLRRNIGQNFAILFAKPI